MKCLLSRTLNDFYESETKLEGYRAIAAARVRTSQPFGGRSPERLPDLSFPAGRRIQLPLKRRSHGPLTGIVLIEIAG